MPSAQITGGFVTAGRTRAERRAATRASKQLENDMAELRDRREKERMQTASEDQPARNVRIPGEGKELSRLEAELEWVKASDLGEVAVARALAKVEAKRAGVPAAPTVAKAQRTVRDLKSKLEGAIEKEFSTQRAWAEAAKRVAAVAVNLAKAEQVEKEAIASRQQELGMEQPHSTGTKSRIMVDEVMAGKVSFDLVLGQDLDLAGLDVSEEDTQELEKRKQTIIESFSASITEAFQPVAELVKKAKEDTAKLRERVEGKRRRTDESGDVHQGVGGGGAGDGAATPGAPVQPPPAESHERKSGIGQTAEISGAVDGVPPHGHGSAAGGSVGRDAKVLVAQKLEEVMAAARSKLAA